jgi:hypothetical protein
MPSAARDSGNLNLASPGHTGEMFLSGTPLFQDKQVAIPPFHLI